MKFLDSHFFPNSNLCIFKNAEMPICVRMKEAHNTRSCAQLMSYEENFYDTQAKCTF